MSTVDKNTQILGYVLLLLSVMLLICWFFKKTSYVRWFGREGMKGGSQYTKGVYTTRNPRGHMEGLSDLETVPVNRHVDKRSHVPYVDLKWRSESLVGINNHEELASSADVVRLNTTVGADLVTVQPNGAIESCDSKCRSIGGIMLKNVDYDPNGNMDVGYAPSRGYVSI